MTMQKMFLYLVILLCCYYFVSVTVKVMFRGWD